MMAPVAAPDIAAAWETAHKESMTTSTGAKAGYLLEAIGPRLGAGALGLADARQLKRWANEDDEPRELLVAQRLDALYWIVRAIEAVYSRAVAARFLRSSNPQLADDAPLIVLGTATDGDGIRRALTATRAFLEG
jgi:hypothetical protein